MSGDLRLKALPSPPCLQTRTCRTHDEMCAMKAPMSRPAAAGLARVLRPRFALPAVMILLLLVALLDSRSRGVVREPPNVIRWDGRQSSPVSYPGLPPSVQVAEASSRYISRHLAAAVVPPLAAALKDGGATRALLLGCEAKTTLAADFDAAGVRARCINSDADADAFAASAGGLISFFLAPQQPPPWCKSERAAAGRVPPLRPIPRESQARTAGGATS